MQKLEHVEHLVKELSAKEKALHVLVNNAGAAWGDSLDDYPVRLARLLCRRCGEIGLNDGGSRIQRVAFHYRKTWVRSPTSN